MMAEDDAATWTALNRYRREIFDPQVESHGGRIIKLMGDGTLVEFPSIVDAVDAAIAIQQASDTGEIAIRLRIGINLGDVIIDGDDIYGDGVNIAARLESLARPGGICVSSIVHESLGGRAGAQFADAGEHQVKNIDRPIRVFRWPVGDDHPRAAEPAATRSSSRLSLAVLEFATLSDETALTHFASGLGHALVTELGRFSVLGVTYLPKASRSTGPPATTRYLLDGSLQASGARIRVSAQLRDAETGEQVWANHVDGETGDLLGFQDDAARRIAGNLHLPLMNHATARARALPLDRAQA
jgi:adenylate cyclase